MLEVLENIIVYCYKYFWVVLVALLLVSIVLFGILSIISKYRLVKKERAKESKLLKMSYEDDNKKSVGKRLNIDEETPKNKKYCSVCHSLVNKREKICPVCKSEFKEI